MAGKRLVTDKFIVCATVGVLGFSAFCLGHGARLSRFIDSAFAIPRSQMVSVETCKEAAQSLSRELDSSRGFGRKPITRDWAIRNNQGCEEDPAGTYERLEKGRRALHENERSIRAFAAFAVAQPQ